MGGGGELLILKEFVFGFRVSLKVNCVLASIVNGRTPARILSEEWHLIA